MEFNNCPACGSNEKFEYGCCDEIQGVECECKSCGTQWDKATGEITYQC